MPTGSFQAIMQEGYSPSFLYLLPRIDRQGPERGEADELSLHQLGFGSDAPHLIGFDDSAEADGDVHCCLDQRR